MNSQKYELAFISDDNLYNHVKQTIETYRFDINLIKFNKNIVDPIKLTFDSLVYKRGIKDLIKQECTR
ncbi:MAG: Eco47II family restriction endonuclease, partial [Vampirovibrionales bacterium]